MDSIVRSASVYREKAYKEEVEWLNFWIETCDKKNRILLIGDSTSRLVRSSLAKLTDMPVDFIGSSSHMLDEYLLRQIEFFFELVPYDYVMIHIQLGCHGIESLPEEVDKDLFYQEYKEQYGNVIRYLQKKAKCVVLGTTTQIVKYSPPKNPILSKIYMHFHPVKSEIPDPAYECDIIRRNSILKELAEEFHIECDDLYSYLADSELKFRHVDHVHYEKKAKMYIAKKIASYLENV